MSGYAIGIDFGSATSCVAVVRNGQVETITNDMGNRTTPSMIGFTETEPLIGDPAKNQFPKNAANTVVNCRRLLGQDEFDGDVVQDDVEAGYFSSKVVQSSSGAPAFEVNYQGGAKQFSAEEISSMVLKKMKDTAELYLGCDVTDAVIGVPYYFKQPERDALEKAAKDAGLNVMRFLNEASAAVMAMEFDNSDAKLNFTGNQLSNSPKDLSRNVVVFDMGGTSCNATLVQVSKDGMFSVKKNISETVQGGDKLSKLVLDFAKKDFKRKLKVLKTPFAAKSKADYRLLAESEEAKHTLSASASALLHVEMLCNDEDYDGTITRARFGELAEEVLQECMYAVDELFQEDEEEEEDAEPFHGIQKVDITDVLVVGGSSKLQCVEEAVQKYFWCKDDEGNAGKVRILTGAENKILQDEVVATGCAIQAHCLYQDRVNQLRKYQQEQKALAAEKGEDTEAETPKSQTAKGKKPEKAEVQAPADVLGNLMTQNSSMAKVIRKKTLALSVGVGGADGAFHTLLRRGIDTPVRRKINVNQGQLVLYEGESKAVADNHKLAAVKVDADNSVVEVSVKTNGDLTVRVNGDEKCCIKKGSAPSLSSDKVDAIVKKAGGLRQKSQNLDGPLTVAANYLEDVICHLWNVIEDRRQRCQEQGIPESNEPVADMQAAVQRANECRTAVHNGDCTDVKEIKAMTDEIKTLSNTFVAWHF